MIWFKAVAYNQFKVVISVCSIVVMDDHKQLCERNMLDRMYSIRQSISDTGGNHWRNTQHFCRANTSCLPVGPAKIVAVVKRTGWLWTFLDHINLLLMKSFV